MVKKGQLEGSKADSDRQGEERDPKAPRPKSQSTPRRQTSGHGGSHGGSMGRSRGK